MPSYVLKRNLGRTNCLTYVPNNIKLELSNGRVVIKAGSKIYVPNGFESDGKTRKFDEVVLASDITSGTGAYSGLYCYNTAGWFSVLTNTVSGSSLASPASLQGWYDTANNIIKRYNNQQGWQTGFSFPICRVTSNGTNITSINQVFQWCGNFGQTQFFLPGIKGLKSNGFNANGTYKNIEVETKSVILNQYTYQATNQQVFIANNGTAFLRNATYYSQETAPALATYSVWHNTKDNFNYYIGDNTSTGWVKNVNIDFPAIPNISTNSSYQVTSLTPATVRTTPTIKDCVLKRKTNKYYKDIVTTKYWKEVETTVVEYACYVYGESYLYASTPIGDNLTAYNTNVRPATDKSQLYEWNTFSSISEDTAVWAGFSFSRSYADDLTRTATTVVEGTPDDYTYTTTETTTVEGTPEDYDRVEVESDKAYVFVSPTDWQPIYEDYTLPKMTSRTAPEGAVSTNIGNGEYTIDAYNFFFNRSWYFEAEGREGSRYNRYTFAKPLKPDTYTISFGGNLQGQDSNSGTLSVWYDDGTIETLITYTLSTAGQTFSKTFTATKPIRTISIDMTVSRRDNKNDVTTFYGLNIVSETGQLQVFRGYKPA